MKFLTWVLAWLIALAIVLIRLFSRIRLHDDPRPGLRAKSRAYIYSVLHAHQVAVVMGAERGTAAMVSASADGALLVPSLRVCGVVPVRGSSCRKGRYKGGTAALSALIEHARDGLPVCLAVDGPRGPRNRVQKGIALLSQETGAAVVNVVVVPSRRWILSGSWDRMQIPKPFGTIRAYFGPPILPRKGEDRDEFRDRIETALSELEQQHDPIEAEAARVATRNRPPR